VDWNQAMAFCAWIGGRLPTAEEREYAAKGGESRIYPWGSEAPGSRACWDGPGNDRGANGWTWTCPVTSHPRGASKHGLLDLAGNVWEWTATDYDGSHKELRGGSWYHGFAEFLRASDRCWFGPSDWGGDGGFRCGL
jgi:formylglycine-generating enzyme required for sulfatase activity